MGDAGVRDTNTDACAKKAHCVARGYWDDPFLQFFARPEPEGAGSSPLINRGYWARVAAMEAVITAFSTRHPAFQVLNLGAGWDTLYFRLRHRGTLGGPPDAVRWVDVDFPEVTRRRCAIIARTPELRRLIPADADGPVAGDRPHDTPDAAAELRSPAYSVLAADLRHPEALLRRLEAVPFRPDLPLLVLAECVLVYLEAPESDALLRALVTAFPAATVAAYEATGPDDAFGQMMVRNLTARGCPLRGIHAYPSVASHRERYEALGLRAAAWDMNAVYARLLVTERQRVERLEWLDEVEEWRLVLAHYCLVVASRDLDPTALLPPP